MTGTVEEVGTNLRLTDELADALRQAAADRGQSQQEIVRQAIAKELGLSRPATAMQQAIQSGLVKPPKDVDVAVPPVALPKGMSTLDLLERDDR